MTQILQPSSLSAEPLYFGVYNMNFYVHSPFQYKLVVRLLPSFPFLPPPGHLYLPVLTAFRRKLNEKASMLQ